MKIGFIGAGNMGGALARAAAKAVDPQSIFLADHAVEKAEALAAELRCNTCTTVDAAQNCDYIFLGVKPQVMGAMLSDIAPVLAARKSGFVLVSMAAGICISDIRKMAGDDYPVIRIMPNIPVSVGSGMILFDTTNNVTEDAKQTFLNMMTHAGVLDQLPEKLIDAGSALSGCGPAFVCLFAEALADGAVACGLTRAQAMTYAAQTLKGTADMLLQTGIHPGELKDAVCSPGGSTIAGVNALEQNGLRAATAEAVVSAYQRTLELGK